MIYTTVWFVLMMFITLSMIACLLDGHYIRAFLNGCLASVCFLAVLVRFGVIY